MKKGYKLCPYCGEEIKEIAKKCRFCGELQVETKIIEIKSRNKNHDSNLCKTNNDKDSKIEVIIKILTLGIFIFICLLLLKSCLNS